MFRRVSLALGLLLAFELPSLAQQSVSPCTRNTSGGCAPVTATAPLPVTGTFSITFPTVGAAVPTTAVYNAINVAGTLRGETGLALGSTYSQTVAIVDASGNQITSFGSSSTSNAPITPAAATATTSLVLGGQYNSTQTTFTNGQQGSLQISSRGELRVVNMDAAGNARGANVDANNNLQVVATPAFGASTTTSASVGVASAQALAAGTRRFLSAQNVSASATVACSFGGTAALNTAGSFTILPYSSIAFANSYVPPEALNCIASGAATPLTILSN